MEENIVFVEGYGKVGVEKSMKENRVVKIDCPAKINCASLKKLILNGKEQNIEGIRKCVLVLEVGQRPRIEIDRFVE